MSRISTNSWRPKKKKSCRFDRAARLSTPKHIAVIMDGNGRWAEARGLPRHAGHKDGIRPVRMCIEECARRGVGALTLFAFSSENWRRPAEEVTSLMGLFLDAIDREVAELHGNRVRLRFIGDRKQLSVKLQARMAASEELTANNTGLKLQVAVSYGGRWDIVQAARRLAAEVAAGTLRVEQIDEARLGAALELGDVPDPDLFIRTGGEHRISNFLLWNLAYTELYVTEALWPDFDVPQLEQALAAFGGRERRFGLTREQAVASRA
jgi:undecaprenyl diphosphate synthase